jgi:dipeptidase D
MDTHIEHLRPHALWHYFIEVCRIPRASKNEGQIAAWLMEFAEKQGLEALRDKVGNVLIRKPAHPGCEKKKAVILQAHMDMVCEKNAATVHDFSKDPIIPRVDGGWIKAHDTTLGADDGIGIAAMLAILESKEIPHGPLEALFTVDEETGLTGAFGLKTGFLKGRILLNLDSEDEGQLFIGCAGGRDTTGTLALETKPVPRGSMAFKISVTGLKGGHSGDDINKGLGNAVKILNRFLWNAFHELRTDLAHIDAGNLRNAIAREGFAVVTIPGAKASQLEQALKRFAAEVAAEYKLTDPGLTLTMDPCEVPSKVMTTGLQDRLFNALYACPHGVITMSAEIPGFVETSTNLASVKVRDGKVILTTSQRSSVESAKKDVSDMVASVLKLAGAEVEHSTGYPGWKPDAQSKILATTVKSYRKLFREEPQVLVIHAGLECGLIGAIYPGMDMVSFGPTIKGAHSPDERLDIASTLKFWKLTLEVLEHVGEE